jgi:hypothetical protein
MLYSCFCFWEEIPDLVITMSLFLKQSVIFTSVGVILAELTVHISHLIEVYQCCYFAETLSFYSLKCFNIKALNYVDFTANTRIQFWLP